MSIWQDWFRRGEAAGESPAELHKTIREMEAQRAALTAKLHSNAGRREEMLRTADDEAILAHDRDAELLHVQLERLDLALPEARARLAELERAERESKIKQIKLEFADACDAHVAILRKTRFSYEGLGKLREKMCSVSEKEATSLPLIFFVQDEVILAPLLREIEALRRAGRGDPPLTIPQSPTPSPNPNQNHPRQALPVSHAKPAPANLPPPPPAPKPVREKIFEKAEDGKTQLFVIRSGLEHKGAACAVGDIIAVPDEAVERIVRSGAADVYRQGDASVPAVGSI